MSCAPASPDHPPASLSMSDSPGKVAAMSSESGLVRRFMRAAVLLGMVAALVGAGHLAAWLGGYLTQRGLSTITMKTNTALCLTLVSVALILLVAPEARWARRWTARVCAAFALLVGLLTFIENVSGWDFGIDQVLAVETPGALAVVDPNRMGMPASLSFTLIGLALLLLSRRDRRGARAVQALALVVCLIALLPTIGFLYRAEQFYGIAQYTGIAWPTAVALLLVGLGLLCARPAEGLMAQVTANDPGGVSLRRLLPAFVILLLLLGWLRLVGERAGVFDTATGTGMLTLLFIIIFSGLTYHASRGVSRSAKVLRQSEAMLSRAEKIADIGSWEWDIRSGRLIWSEQTYRIFGVDCGRFAPTVDSFLSCVHPKDRPRVGQAMEDALAGGKPYDIEYRIVLPGSSTKWIYARGEVVFEESGRPIRMTGTALDVTERKQAEAQVNRSQKTFRELVERAPFGIYIVDSQFRIAHMNTGSQTGAFQNVRPVIGRDFAEVMRILWPEPVAAGIIAAFRHTFETGEPYYSSRFINLRHDVETVEAYEWELHRTTLADGQYGVICYYFDSTRLREAEEALREAHERAAWLARFPEENPNPVLRVSTEGTILYCNPAAAKLLAWTCDTGSPLGEPLLSLIGRAMMEEHEVQQDVELGGRLYSVSALPFPADRYTNIYGRDITERKRAEESLRESEERFRALVTASSEVLYRMSPDWSEMRRLDSRGFLANTERPSRTWLEEYIPPDDQPHVTAAIREAIRTKSVFELEHRVRRADGSLGWTFSRAVPLLGANGEIVEWFGSAGDITEHKQAQEALRQSEAQFRALFENMEDGFAYCQMVFDDDGRPVDFIYLNVNSAFRRLTGLENVIGKRVTEVLPGIREIHPELLETYARVVRTGRPERLEIEFKPLAMWLTIAVYNPQPGHFAAVFDNITERKQAEEALRELNATLENKVAQRTAELVYRARQLQKLTLELTQAEERERRRIAVILHEDLQQQIAAARFHLNLVRSRAQDDRQRAEVDRADETLKEAIEKSRSLSRDLSPAVLHMNDLAEVLHWLAHRMRAQHGLTVRVDVSSVAPLQSEALTMFLFRAAQEMLFNVVQHARVHEAAIRVRRLGRGVGLSVSDPGRGFDVQELKETSGFGLLSLRERTELLGGRMKIRSTPGQGSRLRIVVPDGLKPKDSQKTAEDAVDLHTLSSAVKPLSAGGVLRVLLVDDHEIMRQGLVSLLQESPGIVVVGQAPDGREAITMAHELRPDVVIMDVYMPLMSGEEATRQIKRRLPEARVIALSMYDEPDKREMMYQAGAESYVLKTASAEELCAAIRGDRGKPREQAGSLVKPS